MRLPTWSELLETAVLLAGVVMFAVVVTVFMWLRPEPVMRINSLVVANGEYHPGDILVYTMNYCKFKETSGEAHLAWTDGVSYPMPGMTVSSLAMGCHSADESVLVPNIPPGVYRIEMTRIYDPSPLRRIQISSRSNLFEISRRR